MATGPIGNQEEWSNRFYSLAVLPTTVAFLAFAGFAIVGVFTERTVGPAPLALERFVSVAMILCGVASVGWRMLGDSTIARASTGLGAVLVLGVTAEYVGLVTGFPFGAYEYTGKWWPSVPTPAGPFPVLLPFAWTMIAGHAYLAVAPFVGRALGGLFGGCLAVLVDIGMEGPMQRVFQYWKWIDAGPWDGAPDLNLLGWWLVSAAAGWLIGRSVDRVRFALDSVLVLWGMGVFVLGVSLARSGEASFFTVVPALALSGALASAWSTWRHATSMVKGQ